MPVTKLLLVDDDAGFLNSLAQILTQSGFEVFAVSNVPAALELIHRDTFDVLLTDLNIGEPGDGFTVVSAMRRVQPKTCTFILTGFPDIESAIQAVRNQVDDYFPKPLNLPELLSAIEATRQGTRTRPKPRLPLKISRLLRNRKAEICNTWLEEILKDPATAAIPLSNQERIDHLPEILEEMASRMESHADTLRENAVEAARKHGRLRYQQGYSIPQILLEGRVLQQVLNATVQRELLSLDLSSLVSDTFAIGEVLEGAVEQSVHAYQAQIPQSLQKSFSILYKSPHLGVAIANENRIVDANEALLRMIHYTREQLQAGEISWLDMTPEKYRHLDFNAIEQLREYGACVPYEKEFNLPDGSTLPFLIGGVRLALEPFQWSVYMIDLTEQRKLRVTERKLSEWQSKSAFINRLAHEINNPLAALVFTVHLLETMPEISPDTRGLVKNASRCWAA